LAPQIFWANLMSSILRIVKLAILRDTSHINSD
jgi:hypothetical protein